MSLNGLRTPDRWMAIASAALLAVYFVLALNASASPSDDPQRGMAQGFIILVALVLLAMGGILWLGVARRRAWVIRTVFAVSIFPALSQTAQEIFLLLRHGQ